MTGSWADFLATGLLAHAADAAVRSLGLALLTSVVLVWARRKDAALRLVIWRVVLYSALAMPLMAWLMPGLAIPLPVGSSKPQEQPATQVTFVMPPRQFAALLSSPAHVEIPPRASVPQNPKRPIPWKTIATAIYVVVAGLLLAWLAMGWLLGIRLKRRSRRIEDAKLSPTVAELSLRLGIRIAPEMAESSAVAAPVALGVRRTVILLPATWIHWEPRKLRAVLAHELSHVARHDALTQALAALHRSLFWFSPLGWWLERHLAQLAEEASDDFALNEISDRDFYAQILVDFLAAVVNARGRISWQGVSMAKGMKIERRVNRILSGGEVARRRLRKPAWVAILLVAAPIACLTAAVRPHAQKSAMAAPGGVKTIDPIAAGLGLAITGTVQDEPAPPAPPVAPAPEAVPKPAPAPRAVPAPPMPPKQPSPSRWYSGDEEDGDAFVIVSGDSLTMSGSAGDARHAKSLKSKIPGDFIWFQHDGKGYVIRDAPTVQQAKQLFAPQERLGQQQKELGTKQAELGRKMEELGKQMEAVRVQVPDLTAELKQIEAQLAKLHEGATMEELGEAQSALGELQSKLGLLQGQAGSQQSHLGKKQGELGQQQALLGQTQANLGAQQGRLAREAAKKLKVLLDESVKNGKAQPE